MKRIKHMKPVNNSKRLLKSFYYSACGLKAAFQDHIAFKQAVFLTIAIIPLALILGITAVERVILIGSWFLVLFAEIINSSIEMLVDRISLEIHPLSKKIKDMSSAAVLLAIINAIIVWIIILANHL
jgi:diacylglycerol kinase (ATP)